MSKRALFAFLAVFGAGVLALVAVASQEDKSEAFTLGVTPAAVVIRLTPGHDLCQRPIEAIESFDRVQVQIGTYRRPGPPFVVDVRDLDTGASIARRRVGAGYLDNALLTVTLPRTVPKGKRLAVCIRGVGRRPIAPYGNSGLSNHTSGVYLDGHLRGGDLMLVFLRDKPASVLSLVPSIVTRASLFHGSWASTGAYWVLLVLLLVGPATLAGLAVRTAVRDSP
jgi:hypothetical protein